MKLFLSYKFKGADKRRLVEDLEALSRLLKEKGCSDFIYLRDVQGWEMKELAPGKAIKESFDKIKDCDGVLAFINNPERSTGMLLEIGFSKALGKPVVILILEGVSFPTIEAVSDKVLRFKNKRDLEEKIKKLNLSNLKWPKE